MKLSKADKVTRFTNRIWRSRHSAAAAAHLQGKANTALSDAMKLIRAQRKAEV